MPASFDFHYQEFLGRGLSAAEAKRLAEAVVARDTTGSLEPLELSPAAAEAHAKRDAARRAKLRQGV